MSLPKIASPSYELIQPSTGNKIKYRPFLVKEHKVLLTLMDASDEETVRVVKELVDVCTFNKLDVESLPHFDIEYIFLKLRSKSIGEDVIAEATCDCGVKNEVTFSIDDLVVEKAPEHTNKFMLTDEIGIEMKYPAFEDVVEFTNTEDPEEMFEVVVKNIKSIFNETDYWGVKDQTKKEIEDFIDGLTKEQYDKIETFFKTAPKVVQHIHYVCESCGKENSTRLEGLSNFFV
jgi:hypothetical protein